LHLVEHRGSIVVVGTYHLHEDGVPIEHFLVEIVLPDAYPNGLPAAREVGGRIPPVEDFHVNGDGTLCLGVPEDLWVRYAGRFDLGEYLRQHLRAYFVGVAHKLRGKPWPYGERAHGAAGLCEYYGEVIGTKDSAMVLEFLKMLRKDAVKGHWLCPCGSGKELRRCHVRAIRNLHANLPKPMIKRSLDAVEAAVTKAAQHPAAERKDRQALWDPPRETPERHFRFSGVGVLLLTL
jgi:hypothetical protein